MGQVRYPQVSLAVSVTFGVIARHSDMHGLAPRVVVRTVGRFVGDEVYSDSGNYLGELRSAGQERRLTTSNYKRAESRKHLHRRWRSPMKDALIDSRKRCIAGIRIFLHQRFSKRKYEKRFVREPRFCRRPLAHDHMGTQVQRRWRPNPNRCHKWSRPYPLTQML